MKHYSLRPITLIVLALVLFFTVFTATVAAQDAVTPPQTQPDAAVGRDLFLNRCANCHGTQGAGDGELAVNLPMPPRALNNPEFRKTAVPAEMYDLITNGRLEAGMPPFGPVSTNPIAETDRWHLIAMVYSLSTPAEAIAAGQVIYEENCLACHGINGNGDGPDATGLTGDKLDLSQLTYWFERSNEMVFTELENGRIPEHSYTLSEEERWSAVDYARTFSYAYVALNAAPEAIEKAVISGQVSNGSTLQPFPGEYARLRAFTVNFEEMVNITTTIDATGFYSFTLNDVEPDWIYLTSVPYNDLSFSSDAGQVSSAVPELDLPVTVFETTTSPLAIAVDQIHFIVDFLSEDMIEISELYVFSNLANGVFVGESGNMDEGTIRLGIPENAEALAFERTFGSFENTLPAMEIIETADGWADTLPVRPGQGVVNLIVRYQLPYEDGMQLTHPMYYNVQRASFILPDVGVTVSGTDWQFDGSQQMGSGTSFLSYSRQSIESDAAMSITLTGEPTAPTAMGSGSVAPPRNESQELMIGGGILLIALAGVGLFVYTQRVAKEEEYEEEYDDYDDEDEDMDGVEDLELLIEPSDKDELEQLLQKIADLDDAHDAGNMETAAYQQQRDQLKAQLKALWG